jgi:hypothetical protein
MENILVPIFICVVLPVAVVFIVGRAKQNETNRKTEVMLRAIEAGVQLDPSIFASDAPRKKSLKEDMVDKLTGACITGLMGFGFLTIYVIKQIFPGSIHFAFSGILPFAGVVMLAVGIGLFISYQAGKKLLAKELEAEEKELK